MAAGLEVPPQLSARRALQGTDSCPSDAARTWCDQGWLKNDKYCCAASCGQCGGSGCDGQPGGSSNCCVGPIKKADRKCTSYDDTTCVVPPEPPEPPPLPEPAADAAGNLIIDVGETLEIVDGDAIDADIISVYGTLQCKQYSGRLGASKRRGPPDRPRPLSERLSRLALTLP